MTKYISLVQDIISQYDIKLTIRQIFYRLVAASHIPNTRSRYNSLDHTLAEARRNGVIPYNAIEDRTREFLGGESFFNQSPEDCFECHKADYESAEDLFRQSHRDYNLPFWHSQPRYVEVWLEKDALAGVFQSVTGKYHVRLAPCRGYPSLSFLYEARQHLWNVPDGKEIVILYFGDFDMRGKDIERFIRSEINGTVKRVALTKEQIQAYNLPSQPSKKNDTMARGWIETHGDVAWELDALPPDVLVSIIEEAILQNIDKPILEQRNQAVQLGRYTIDMMIHDYFGDSDG